MYKMDIIAYGTDDNIYVNQSVTVVDPIFDTCITTPIT